MINLMIRGVLKKSDIIWDFFSKVGEAEGQLLISAKRRFTKPTNPCRNLKIFMEENLLKKNCNGSAICRPISKTLKDEKTQFEKKWYELL